MKSIWKQDVVLKVNRALQRDMSVNTVVIGAGMTGILTAYYLQKMGISVIVLEAERIASGQTQNTTAKITSQHGLYYKRMNKKIGRKKMEAYANANEEAIQKFEKIIEEEKIECHFKRLPAYLYSTQEDGVKKLQNEAKAAKALGIKAHFINGNEISELPFEIKAAVCFENQAQFHPLEFIKHLAEKITIYENTRVLSVKKHTIYTDRGKIEADHIVFAAHYPFINIPGFYFLRQHQERSYVMALKTQKALTGMYYSIDEDGLSLRSTGDILLLGGGSHRTGKKINCHDERFGYSFLRKMKQRFYPDAEMLCAWSAQDCMPHDDIPFIGKYSIIRPYWYVATGFRKWGMTTAMIAADLISAQIQKDSIGDVCTKKYDVIDKYAAVFTPQRFLFRASIKNLMIDIAESVSGLSKGIFSKTERRCPHMGCRLEWNPEEKSWDCPCHGSRFTPEGELKDNPSQIDLGDRN